MVACHSIGERFRTRCVACALRFFGIIEFSSQLIRFQSVESKPHIVDFPTSASTSTQRVLLFPIPHVLLFPILFTLFIFYFLLILYSLLFILHSLLFTIYHLLFIIYYLPFFVYSIRWWQQSLSWTARKYQNKKVNRVVWVMHIIYYLLCRVMPDMQCPFLSLSIATNAAKYFFYDFFFTLRTVLFVQRQWLHFPLK